MKIAFCIFKYFLYGGLQRDFRALLEECLLRGHSIDVFTLEWHGERLANVNVRIIPVRTVSNHARYKKFGKKLGEIFTSEHYDLVVGYNKIPYLDVYSAGDPCYAAKVHQLRSALYRLSPRYFTLLALEKAVFDIDTNTQILLMTMQQKKEFMAYYHTSSDRFYISPPWLKEDKHPVISHQRIRETMRETLHIAHDDIVLLMIGSGFKTKGLDRAILAIHSLPKTLRDKAHFFVIGDDNAKPFMRTINNLKLEKIVQFLGGQSNIRDYLYAADVLIHPAYSETAGNVIIEAIVNGLPVIVTDVCGYAHHVKEANAGVIVPSPFSQDFFNQSLADMLQSPCYSEWRMNGRKYFDQHNFHDMPKLAVNHIEKVNHGIFRINNAKTVCFMERSLAETFTEENFFSSVMALEGEVYRHKENRKTLRFVRNNQAYFAKLHEGVGWKEIIKNIFQMRLPITSAKNEWQALFYCEQLHIPTMKLVGYGMRGQNPAAKQSFLITKELPNMMNLEDLCRSRRLDFYVKQALIEKLADMIGKLHRQGLNHRDLYFCHFLLAKDTCFERRSLVDLTLYLIDLHRVQCRSKVGRRWLIKDLGSLYFSTIGMPITKNDVFRFIKLYTRKSLRHVLQDNKFWKAVEKRGHSLYKKACRNLPGYPVEINS